MQKSFIVVLITAVIVAVFAVLNTDIVNVNLMFVKFPMSLALVILVSAVLGALSMFLMNILQVLKLKRQIKQLSKKLIDSDSKNVDLNVKIQELNNEIALLTPSPASFTAEDAGVEQPLENADTATTDGQA